MELEIYQIDAFTDKLFSGNPAAVVPLDNWLSDELLQKIAEENNLAETAFYIPEGDHFHIRWFTPTKEVALCGHATLAAAFVIDLKGDINENEITFNSQSGILKVEKVNSQFVLDFPRADAIEIDTPDWVKECIGVETASVFQCNRDILLVYDDDSIIKNIAPDLQRLKNVKARGIIVSARSSERNVDFVSRFFAPASGIDEDSVTGSSHTSLAPFWSGLLNKDKLIAKQISKRGGILHCEVLKERVKIGGNGKLYLKGIIQLS
jgi:PhzF family phenazine biosynthesis protein